MLKKYFENFFKIRCLLQKRYKKIGKLIAFLYSVIYNRYSMIMLYPEKVKSGIAESEVGDS